MNLRFLVSWGQKIEYMITLPLSFIYLMVQIFSGCLRIQCKLVIGNILVPVFKGDRLELYGLVFPVPAPDLIDTSPD